VAAFCFARTTIRVNCRSDLFYNAAQVLKQ